MAQYDLTAPYSPIPQSGGGLLSGLAQGLGQVLDDRNAAAAYAPLLDATYGAKPQEPSFLQKLLGMGQQQPQPGSQPGGLQQALAGPGIGSDAVAGAQAPMGRSTPQNITSPGGGGQVGMTASQAQAAMQSQPLAAPGAQQPPQQPRYPREVIERLLAAGPEGRRMAMMLIPGGEQDWKRQQAEYERTQQEREFAANQDYRNRDLASRTAYQNSQLGLQRQTLDRNGPETVEAYDPATGRPVRMQWDGKAWAPIGGPKSGSGTDGYGTTPIWGTDASGKPAILQLGKDGTPIQTPMPPGFNVARDAVRIDTGTGTALIDPQTRQQVGFIPKDVAGEAAATTIGKGQGEAAVSLPGARQTAGLVTQQIADLKSDPYLSRMVGPVNSRLPNVSGDAARVQARMDQLQGGAFLQARQLLKGGGQITDYEGKKAEMAWVRMNAAQNEGDFKKALDEFQSAVTDGVAKLEAQAGPRGGQGAAGNGAGVPSQAVQALRQNPALRDQFEAKYGPGSAARALGQ